MVYGSRTAVQHIICITTSPYLPIIIVSSIDYMSTELAVVFLAVGIGNVRITDSNGIVRVLEGVLYVPRLKCGLMALNRLALLGWTSIITKDGCTVSDSDFSIHSEIRNGLCVWSL